MAALKVVLVHSPLKPYFDPSITKDEGFTPPLSLLYLAAPLKKAGYDIVFVDFDVQRPSRVQFEHMVSDAAFVLLSAYSESAANAKKLIRDIRHANPRAYIIVGGPYCSLTENYVDGADMVVIGEAEQMITEILARVTKHESLVGIPGLIYRNGGKLVRNRGILKVKDLNKSEFPLTEIADRRLYGSVYGIHMNDVAGVVSSRGCPFNCTYCTHRGRTGYRERSVQNVMQELRELVKLGYRYVIFYDDNFLANKRRVNELMDAIIMERLPLRMFLQGRVDSADFELYKKLKAAGVRMISFGIENANQDVLDFYHKQASVSQIRQAVTLADRAGILTLGFFILGAPIETRAHFERNMQFTREVPLDAINVGILTYFKGSKLWEDAHKKGLVGADEVLVKANRTLSKFTYEELQEIRWQWLKDFYSDPKRLARLTYKLIGMGEVDFFFKALHNLGKVKTVESPWGKSQVKRISAEE